VYDTKNLNRGKKMNLLDMLKESNRMVKESDEMLAESKRLLAISEQQLAKRKRTLAILARMKKRH
jgi:hypothetical protein